MTDDGNRLSYQPDIKYFKDRNLRLTEGSPEAADREAELVLPEMVAELDRKVKGVLGKIAALQDEIKRTTKNYISVHDQAYEVQQALRTLFPDRPSNIIMLDQYVLGLEWTFRRSSVNMDRLINVVTGNTEVDARLIDQMSWESSDSVSPEELAIIAGQFLLTKMANKIMKPYTCQDSANIAAPKLYPGTERAPATAQIMIGLAALLLQIAENRDAVKKAVNKAIEDFPMLGGNAESVVAQAEALGKDPSIDEWQKGLRPYHWDVLVRYVQDFLGNTTDPGYEGWQVYEQMEAHKNSMASVEAEFDHYGRTTAEATASAWQLSMDMYRMMFFQTVDTNEQVNKAATILSSKELNYLLCCLVIFGGSIPTKHLKLLRFALSIQSNGLSVDLSASLEASRNKANSFLAERVLEPILQGIDRFFAKYAKEALALVDRNQWKDKELYDILMACASVDQVIEYGLRGIEKLKDKLVELLMRVWNRLEVKSVKGNLSWRLMADSKRCRQLLSTIDKIIEGVERGNLCAREGGTTPTADEIEEFVNRFNSGLSAPVNVPTEGDPYEVFTLKPFASSTGIMFPEADELDASGSMDNQATGMKRFRVEDCLRRNANPQELLKALGLSVQLGRDLRDASNIDKSRPNT
jgi:hypothetical protein